jgi:glutathione S-transferase
MWLISLHRQLFLDVGEVEAGHRTIVVRRELQEDWQRLAHQRLGFDGVSDVSDYELYYWPVPFRGQFVRAVLAFAGKTWKEGDAAAISDLMGGAVADMPVPFMGPPMLIDKKADFAIAEMPAIVLYLAETLALMPKSAALRALTIKTACDANDVIDEITIDGGREMWTKKSWQEFIPRLQKWMSFWEETGRRHGLRQSSGFLLGGDEPGVADVITCTLWSTMTERLPPIQAILEEAAPMTAALSTRVSKHPALAKLAAKARKDYGDAYCGGEIEKSLRKVLGL